VWPKAPMKILVLNSGSSSQKSALFELAPGRSTEPAAPLWEGKIEWEGEKEVVTVKSHQPSALGHQDKRREQEKAKPEDSRKSSKDRQESVEKLLEQLWRGDKTVIGGPDEIDVIGHRIVHGGPKLTEPAVITPAVKRAIEDVATIAPLHNQAGLQGIASCEHLFPGVTQVAVFDTGFHRTIPLEAKVYPGPYSWYQQGIHRYGFHGINHEYCATRAAQMLQRDLSALSIVTCHLGNGCSLAAIAGGRSVDTTMGFTPLEGLMMGTRSGSIDPGILTHLIRSGAARADQLDGILNRESGLLGISGVSSDMREVLQATRSGNERATLAFDIFIHRLRKSIAEMVASLQSLDVLVFTAGIGENSPEVRKAACDGLKFLKVSIDDHKNAAANSDADISGAASDVYVLVIAAQEDWSIANKCVHIAASRPAAHA
jgi:acetate kinase